MKKFYKNNKNQGMSKKLMMNYEKKNIYFYIYEYKIILNFYINIEQNIIYAINYIKNIKNE